MSDGEGGLIVPPSYDDPVEEVRHITSGDSGSASERQGDAPPDDVQPELTEEQIADHGYDFDEPSGQPESNCLCTFVVVVGLDGSATGFPSFDTIPTEPVPMRAAGHADMWRACTEIVEDIHVSRLAQTTVAMFMQSAQQAAQAQMDQRVVEDVMRGGVPLGGNRAQRRQK